MKIIITGSNSFIGRSIVPPLAEKGHCLYGLQRSHTFLPGVIPLGRLEVMCSPQNTILWHEAEAIIHLIHDRSIPQENLLGFISWYDELEKAATKAKLRQIYISSYSARPDAVSLYGKTKFALESLFIRRGHSVVRPALVLGQGGVFGNILRLAQNCPIIPVPGGNHIRMPFISSHQLADALHCMLTNPQAPIILNAASVEHYSLKEMLQAALRHTGKKKIYISVPMTSALWGLHLVERLHIKLPFSSDSLASLILPINYHQSNLHTLIERLETLEEAVSGIVQ